MLLTIVGEGGYFLLLLLDYKLVAVLVRKNGCCGLVGMIYWANQTPSNNVCFLLSSLHPFNAMEISGYLKFCVISLTIKACSLQANTVHVTCQFPVDTEVEMTGNNYTDI
jgi:hypothetical protein